MIDWGYDNPFTFFQKIDNILSVDLETGIAETNFFANREILAILFDIEIIIAKN